MGHLCVSVNHACLSLPLRGSSSLSMLSSPTMCCGLICSVRHRTGSVIKLQRQSTKFHACRHNQSEGLRLGQS